MSRRTQAWNDKQKSHGQAYNVVHTWSVCGGDLASSGVMCSMASDFGLPPVARTGAGLLS